MIFKIRLNPFFIKIKGHGTQKVHKDKQKNVKKALKLQNMQKYAKLRTLITTEYQLNTKTNFINKKKEGYRGIYSPYPLP